MTKIPVLFELMDNNKVTQKQLAAAIGVSQGNIGDWKSGRSSPGREKLSKIAEYFNVSVDYLLGNEKQKSDNEKLSFALFGTSDVDEELLNDVRKYAEIARRIREEKKEGH